MPKKHKPRTYTAYLQCLGCEQMSEKTLVPFSPFLQRTFLDCGCDVGARHVDAETGFDLRVQQHIESSRFQRAA